MNLDCHGERPVTNCLNHGMAPPLGTVIALNLLSLVLLMDLQTLRWEQGGMNWTDLAQDGDK